MTRDLLYQDEVRAAVRAAYSSISSGAGEALAHRFYSPEELALVPAEAVAWALGVGNPVRHAELRGGDTVLDVGCGAGIDTILAAHSVGPSGRVIGLDLLEAMCARARENATHAGVGAWTEFCPGEMERIPLEADSVDHVISNGSINLSPRKRRVMHEIARVLRPGGRFTVVDLTLEEELPPPVLGTSAAWAGCVAGAMSERVFRNRLRYAGFEDIDVSDRVPFGIDDLALYPLFPAELIDLMRELIAPELHDRLAWSVLVRARQPV